MRTPKPYPIFPYVLLLLLMVSMFMQTSSQAQETQPNRVLATFDGQSITTSDYNLYLRSNRGPIVRNRPNYPDHPKVLEDFALTRIASASLEKQVTHEVILKALRWEIWSLECKEAYTRIFETVFTPGTTPSQEEIEKFYQEHLTELAGRKEFSFRNIFFDLSRCNDDSCRSETERTANETLSILKAQIDSTSGTVSLSRFLEVASLKTGKATSEFQVRGPFPMGEINAELERTAMSLQPGQISGLLKTRTGLQILRLETKSTGESPTLEQATEGIRQRIQTSRISQHRRDFQETLTDSSKIQISTEGFGELVRWATAPNEVKDVVMANVGPFTLKVLDYLNYVKLNSRDFLPLPEQSAQEIRESHENIIRSRIIEQELIRQKAEELGLTRDATYTNRVKIGMEVLVGGRYLQLLNQSHFVTLSPIPENEIEEYFRQHSDEYQSGAQYKLREIAIKPRDATEPVEVEMAMREAEKKALEAVEAIQKGTNEEELIRKVSSGEEAASGGVTGWLLKDTRYSPLVWKDLISLSPGSWTSKSYRHRGLAVVLKMEEMIPSEPLTLEQARSEIEAHLQTQRRQAESKRLRNELLRNAHFTLVQDEVDRLIPMKDIFN